ncbi:MAG: outer membrane protein assembly factor BamA, partial [Mailhella sp.]|nr:outer membrane protein assembly factor BamA [Mailhella sp.]
MKKTIARFFGALFAALILVSAGSAWAAPASKVLLLPFAVNAPDASIGKDVGALFANALKKQGYSVIRPKSLPAPDAATARAEGKKAGADHVVYGTVSVIGQNFVLEPHIVDTFGRMNRTHTTEGSLVQLAAKIDETGAVFRNMAGNKAGISEIKLDGVKLIDPDRVLVRVRTRAGDAVDVDAIDADVRSIWDMGYFSDVRADIEEGPSGEILTFFVDEKPRIESIRVEGAKAVRLKDITEAMATKTGSVLNEKQLANDIQVVTELYRQKGYYLADVQYEIQPRKDNTGAALVFKVDEGSKLYIREIRIDGMDEKLQKDLKKYTKLRTRGFFSWLTGNGILKEETLKSDAQAVQGFLIENGYLDAGVAEPDVQYSSEGISIVFKVKMGERYKLGEIGFKGELIEPESKLYDIIDLDREKEKNTYFKLSVLREDIKKLTEMYNDYGYAFATVDAETPQNAAERTVDVYYVLNPKEKVYLRRVILEGNDRTRDNVILRELRVADGQQYDGALVRRSTVRLNKLNYFETVDTKLIPTGNPGEVDLKIGVKEKSTGTIGLGVGYSTYDKFGVSANITERNLFGRGYNVSAQGYLSGGENSFRTNFTNPRLYNTYLGMSIDGYIVDDEWVSFDKRTIGGRLSFFYPLGEYTHVGIGYRLDNYTLSNISENASPIIKDYEGSNWASVAHAFIARDTTNSAVMPTEGTKARLSLEYGGSFLMGDDNFFKLIAEYGFYYQLFENHVLHARGTYGMVLRNTKHDVPAFERFYIGGMDSLRGYSYEDISPIDPVSGDSIGATHVTYGSLEYIYAFRPSMGLFFVPFFDIGTSVDKAREGMFSRVYYSAGLELRRNSPLGNLRFAYGFPLAKNVR